MKKISVDNGMHYVEPEEALESVSLDVMAYYMDDDAREAAHREQPDTAAEFLRIYLELAPCDLVIE